MAPSMLGTLAGLPEDNVAASREAAASDPTADVEVDFPRVAFAVRAAR